MTPALLIVDAPDRMASSPSERIVPALLIVTEPPVLPIASKSIAWPTFEAIVPELLRMTVPVPIELPIRIASSSEKISAP